MSTHEVVLRFVVTYEGEARHFNPDDVRTLAEEGIESHYVVTESTLVSTDVLSDDPAEE